jgi:hypothetical protein
MLRYAALVVRLEHADHVRLVPVRPHSCVRDIASKKLLWPERLSGVEPPSVGTVDAFLLNTDHRGRLLGLTVLWSLLPALLSSQVLLGCPRKPWTKTILCGVSHGDSKDARSAYTWLGTARSPRFRYQTVVWIPPDLPLAWFWLLWLCY